MRGHCPPWLLLSSKLDNSVRTLSAIQGNKMKTFYIEIRQAEGGEDSRLFALDLAQAYQRYFTRVG